MMEITSKQGAKPNRCSTKSAATSEAGRQGQRAKAASDRDTTDPAKTSPANSRPANTSRVKTDPRKTSGARIRRAKTGPAQTRANLYDEVTLRIIAELEEGRFPWAQPWGRTGGTGPGIPRNALTARPYSGVNILILWGAVIEQGWPSQSWLTFRQALEAGGNVRKGEHGVTVVYADRFTPEAEKQRARESGEDARSIPFLKRFTLFNIAQCEGLRADLVGDPASLPERDIIPLAEAVIAASGVDFRIGGDKAFYVPAHDYAQVPPQPAFFEQINYYRTCLHELTHATGHVSRLDRFSANGLGGKDYAREELVAEMGAAFLCAALGIVPTVRHADYLASWLGVLREDHRAIFRAASAASKAADWILARHASSEQSRGAEADETIRTGRGIETWRGIEAGRAELPMAAAMEASAAMEEVAAIEAIAAMANIAARSGEAAA